MTKTSSTNQSISTKRIHENEENENEENEENERRKKRKGGGGSKQMCVCTFVQLIGIKMILELSVAWNPERTERKKERKKERKT